MFGASGKGLFWLGTAPVCIQYLFKSSNLVQEIEFRGRNKASQSVFFIFFLCYYLPRISLLDKTYIELKAKNCLHLCFDWKNFFRGQAESHCNS